MKVGKTLYAVGLAVMMLGVMALDSQGVAGIAADIATSVGGLIAVTGYFMVWLYDTREDTNRRCRQIRQRGKQDDRES